jgi:hypothetical protein
MRTAALVASVFTVLSAFTASAQDQGSVTAEVIGSFEGRQTFPQAINNTGNVVGGVFTPETPSGFSSFIWSRRSGFRIIAQDSFGTGVNDRGEVVGTLNECIRADDGGALCETKGFVWNPASGLRVLPNFIPARINNNGDMAGSCTTGLPCGIRNGLLKILQCDLGDECGGVATAINQQGDMAGYTSAQSFGNEAVLWPRLGGAVRLAPNAAAFGINDKTLVVGFSGGIGTAWLPSGEAKHVLQPDFSLPRVVNASGLVAGTTWEYPGKAFAWNSTSGAYTFLSPDAFLSEAVDINDFGEVLGYVTPTSTSYESEVVIWRVNLK